MIVRSDIEEHASVRGTTALADFAANGAGHYIASQQFGRPPRFRPLASHDSVDPTRGFLFQFQQIRLETVREYRET
jgi:hypothetical protein